MQLRQALQTGLRELLQHDVPSAQLAAELLLMHVFGCDRSYLYTHPEEELAAGKSDRYLRLIAERATGKPTQYITGHQEFWGLDLEVTPAVLIPRPETEHVVEAVLDLARRQGLGGEAPISLVDVGTGSGAIALALALELPRAAVFATDFSVAALEVAQRNAARLGFAERVTFVQGDLLAPLLATHAGRLDFVVSNPPYVGAAELDSVQREVREFEPRLAWGGLERDTEIYERLLPQAEGALRPGGHLVVEIGYKMREAVVGLFGAPWTEVEVRPDLAGIPRVVTARKPPGREPRVQ
jgi:release factor glutamine methyltransferase